MIVGHYAASFAAKAVDKRIPLWVLFIAAQAVDIVWAVLVLLGIEKVRIVPGITASSPLDLYYYPYTHSLLASVLWLGLAVIAYKLLRPGEGAWRMGLIVGLAVFSHWVLDLLVHRPDLPLYDDTLKVGLGLWNYPLISFLLEAGLLLGGLWLYFRATAPATPAGKYGMLAFGILLLMIQAGTSFGPPPPSPEAVATIGLISYFAFAVVAYWLDKKRR
jgi:membrane-bound metal-dependent hydrolase YbcI (DUF457 family)